MPTLPFKGLFDALKVFCLFPTELMEWLLRLRALPKYFVTELVELELLQTCSEPGVESRLRLLRSGSA